MPKILALRRDDTCPCGAALPAGTRAAWISETRTVLCLTCAEQDRGTAGASAQAEFQRRHDRREQRIREAHPRLGGLILALSDDPQSTRAWEAGAIGEQRLAAELAKLGDDVIALHDRRVPRSRANIDHIVVGPAGVYVIDAKRYKNAKISIRTSGGFLSDVKRQLIVSGRDKSALVTAMHRQVDVVRTALATTRFAETPIAGALCFIDAEFPMFGKPLVLDGIHIRGLDGTAKLVATGDELDAETRAELAATLATELPAK